MVRNKERANRESQSRGFFETWKIELRLTQGQLCLFLGPGGVFAWPVLFGDGCPVYCKTPVSHNSHMFAKSRTNTDINDSIAVFYLSILAAMAFTPQG